MSLTKLELCKAIADIEGLDDVDVRDGKLVHVGRDGMLRAPYKECNPIADKAWLFDLQIKHKVELEFRNKRIYAIIQTRLAAIESVDDSGAPRAILECIVGANG
jgi:hypothetical protein